MKKDHKAFHSIRKPGFLGGKKAFQEFLEKNLQYPAEALMRKKEGMAHVKCEVSDKGKVLKAESINKLGFGLDEEAERLCMLMQFENTEERGMKIKHTRTTRIPFILPKAIPVPVEPAINITYETTSTEKKGNSYNYTIKFG